MQKTNLQKYKNLFPLPEKNLKILKAGSDRSTSRSTIPDNTLPTNPTIRNSLRSKNKGQFRQEHSSELAIYETAVKFLKEKASDGQLPTLQTLKAEKEKLLVQKKEA